MERRKGSMDGYPKEHEQVRRFKCWFSSELASAKIRPVKTRCRDLFAGKGFIV